MFRRSIFAFGCPLGDNIGPLNFLPCPSCPQRGRAMKLLHPTILFLLATIFLDPACADDKATLSAADTQFFETRIRPALAKYCFECHSTTATDVGGKLLLDSREALLQGGEIGSPVIAGKPDESLIIQALRYDGIEMPPGERVPEAVVNDFVEWVRRGAPYPGTTKTAAKDAPAHDSEALWAFEPPDNPPIPDVLDATWPRDPVDRFVLAKIEAAGLQPTADADPRTLVRRLYFDLTGIPPSFAQVEEFVASYEQTGAKSVERLVDELLASPQFGERWGRHWLDSP